MADHNRGIRHTLLVALLVSLVCSVVVATAAVLLEPRRVQNEQQALRRHILDVAGRLDQGGTMDEAFASVDVRVVDLGSGEYAKVDPDSFDSGAASRDPDASIAIPESLDIAQIDRRPKLGKVYLVRHGDEIERIVLPIQGYGLWSTLYGLIALTPDASEVMAIKFYEHGETPGLGDQIEKPEWRASWQGKKVYDDSGSVAIEVVKGAARPTDPQRAYQVDGLTGATITSRGVSNTVRYWLGPHGYGPYLRSLERQDET